MGLSGCRRLFIGSAVVYAVVWLAGLIAVSILMNNDQRVETQTPFDPDRWIAALQWLAAAAVIAKLLLATVTWRRIGAGRARQYLGLWLGATMGLVSGAVMIWADGTLSALLMAVLGFPPIDSLRLASLLILGAMLLIPFARIGLVPGALAGNRHGRINDP